MYINRLHVKNLKRMRDLSLDFTHEGKPRMWTVLVAENGACKTTLLQAIALVASGSDRANQLADVPSLPDLRRPAEDAVRLRADFEFGTRLEKWRVFPEASKVFFKEQRSPGLRSSLDIEPRQSTFRGASLFASVNALASSDDNHLASDSNVMVARLKRLLSEIKDEEDDVGRFVWKLEGEDVRSDAALLSWLGGYALALQNPIAEARAKSLPGWFVAGYGTQRQIPVPLSASEQKDRVLNRLEPLFGKAPLVGTGFANQFVDTPRFEPFLQALTKVFVDNQLLPHVDAVELRGRGGVTQPGDLVRSHSFEFAFSGQKTKIPATWLSQGYQSTIAWIADLIGQMYLDVGEAIPLEDMEGMVLIDELDLHLHPRWQVRLVPVLKRVFPRMQFIVTTHSPMLLPALERHEIIMLRLDEHGDVVAEPPPTWPKLLTGSEIYSSFFNIQKF
ncbi:AAA family ATPase [Cystobacter fuscus]|uniref:AAA family ATPase n=1 Tax=Cystobacter fuscus TaxID=43 RepID=UPI002B31F922|nr:AAA family ATPase [Cystobacter fuscus]